MTPEEEWHMLDKDDLAFSNTKQYLEPLIDSALSHFVIANPEQEKLRQALLSDAQLAAGRFLRNQQRGESSFSDYFTYYIAERINLGDYEKM